MKFISKSLKDAYLVITESSKDKRGSFSRLFCEKEFNPINSSKKIVQINHSATKSKGSIRGMHYQESPALESKIVTCIKGSVYDVIIDLRKNSETFLKWTKEILTSKNNKMLYVPEGFAHGFQTLENNCELLYLHSQFYNPNLENGIHFKEPKVNIDWPLDIAEISEKDNNIPFLSENFIGIDFEM